MKNLPGKVNEIWNLDGNCSTLECALKLLKHQSWALGWPQCEIKVSFCVLIWNVYFLLTSNEASFLHTKLVFYLFSDRKSVITQKQSVLWSVQTAFFCKWWGAEERQVVLCKSLPEHAGSDSTSYLRHFSVTARVKSYKFHMLQFRHS